jgi:hypothetical protein
MITDVIKYFSSAASFGGYVNLSKSSDQVITANAKITFDGVANGDPLLFDNADDEVVVPVGATLVRVNASFWQTNTRNLIRKAGATFNGQVGTIANNQGRRSFATPPLIVTTDDVFDFHATGSSGTHAGAVWTSLGMEIMDPETIYCVAKLNADVSLGVGSTTTVAWDGADIADVHAMHDPSSNNTRVSIPSGLDIVYARPFFNLYTTGNVGERSAWVDLVGSSYNGRPICDSAGDTDTNLMAYGAIIPVTAGTSYFTISTFSEGGNTLEGGANQSFFGAECFLTGYSHCTAYKAATQALTADVEATLLLTGEVTDTDNCHSTSSDTGNFVCPAGKTRARLTFNVKGASTGVGEELIIIAKKNGSAIQGLPSDGRENDTDEACNGIGNWIPVTSGDILRVDVTSTVNQTLPATGQTWVCVEWA